MWERWPLKHARNIQTPAVFIQGEADEWTPDDQQVEQMFRALMRHGVETELVRYTGENHGHFQNGKPRTTWIASSGFWRGSTSTRGRIRGRTEQPAASPPMMLSPRA